MKLFRNAVPALAALWLLAGPALAADNVAVTAGSGKTIGCKDIGAVCYVVHMLAKSDGTVIADPSAIAATQSGTWNITNISGTITLPTGASTSAKQDTMITELGAPGDTACASDTASCSQNAQMQRVNQRLTTLHADVDQLEGFVDGIEALLGTGNTSLASIDTKLSTINTTLGTPASAANQTTGNTSLSSIDTKLSTLNTTTAAAASPPAVTATDKGGTVTTGGTAQNAMASNASRKGGWIQNPCTATESIFVSTSTTATTTGASDDAELPACATFSLVTSGGVIQSALSVIAATTGHRWIAKEVQ